MVNRSHTEKEKSYENLVQNVSVPVNTRRLGYKLSFPRVLSLDLKTVEQ
jgi:hypothetical protein